MKRVAALVLMAAVAALAAPQAATGLGCEYLTDPLGIDVTTPRLGWVPTDTARGAAQSAYQVLVSAEPGVSRGDAWDSGRVASPEFVHIVYGGAALQTGRTYYWKVRYWDEKGEASPWSAVAKFEMGLLSPSDWKARWMRGGNVMRKEFELSAAPVRARAYVTGIGYYELRLNGEKVGNRVLDPGYTSYEKRVLYATYDVTRQLKAGKNAVGLMLGEGWYHARAGLVQLEIDLAGGGHVRVVSNGTWKAAQGPIVSDSLYNGEVFDARREMAGWDGAGFDDSAWKPVSLENPPQGILSAEMMPPIRVVASIYPRKMTNPRPGVYVFDMGQNFSGWTRIRVKGAAGTRVTLRHAETIYKDGTINVENLRTAKATDVYVLKGDPAGEVYEPRFTYHGFRYVEVTGYPGTPSLDAVTGREVHTDVKTVGGFAASKPLLTQIQENVVWATKTNLHSIPTDCDQRDERKGWLADAHLGAEQAMWNFDMAAFYTNYLRSIHDDQDETGSLPDTVPHGTKKPGTDPAWGAAYPLLVEYMWEHYGDRRIVEQHFGGIKRWADWLHTKADTDGIVAYVKFGDWVPIVPTPGDVVSTAYYYISLDAVAKMAAVLGKSEEQAQYRQMADAVAAGFRKRFWHADSHTFGNGSQTADVLPLALGMVTQAERKAVTTSLLNDIVYYHNTHLTTGILGTKYLLTALSQNGHPDLAYDLATQTTYPSWGYMVEQGATTIWELWQNVTGPSMNSHNHPMYGTIGSWFYTALAGINLDQDKPGFERVLIAPEMTRDLKFASGSVDTVRGRVATRWERDPEDTKLEVTVPVGSTAEVDLPVLGMRNIVVREGGRVVWSKGAFVGGAPGISGAKIAGGKVVFEVGSGNYVFEAHEGDVE